MLNWSVKKEEKDVEMKPASPQKTKPRKKGTRKKPPRVKTETKLNISSADEEEQQKSKPNARSKRTKQPRNPVKMETTLSGFQMVESDGLPDIRDLACLVQDNPHMCTDMTQSNRCVGSKSGKDEKENKSKKQDTDGDVKMSTVENPLSRPLEDVQCQRRLDQLAIVNPVIVDGQSWKLSDKIRLLRQNQLYLPLLKASFESELLAASGTWKHFNGRVYTFPACKRAEKCVGMDGTIPFSTTDSFNGKPFKYILTSFMLPEEYAQFLKDGRPPLSRQLCIACMRTLLVDTVCAFRGGEVLADTKDAKESKKLSMQEDMLLQCYRNLVECDEGYYRELCLEPNDEQWEGIVNPIATFRASLLVARKGRFNRPYIDQSALVWKPGVTGRPALGESIKDFSTGVSF